MQQKQIESLERDVRLPNAIFVGVPEEQVCIDNDNFSEDSAKVNFLCSSLSLTFDIDVDIESCSRLRTPTGCGPRLLKIRFTNIKIKFEIVMS